MVSPPESRAIVQVDAIQAEAEKEAAKHGRENRYAALFGYFRAELLIALVRIESLERQVEHYRKRDEVPDAE